MNIHFPHSTLQLKSFITLQNLKVTFYRVIWIIRVSRRCFPPYFICSPSSRKANKHLATREQKGKRVLIKASIIATVWKLPNKYTKIIFAKMVERLQNFISLLELVDITENFFLSRYRSKGKGNFHFSIQYNFPNFGIEQKL